MNLDMRISKYEIDETLYTNRFTTQSKEKAYGLMEKLNSITSDYGREWRVGKCISDRVCIEIDDHDNRNLLKVMGFYSRMLQDTFHVIKTLHGFHLIQRGEIEDKERLQLSRIKVLYPGCTSNQMVRYIDDLKTMMHDLKSREGHYEFGTDERLYILRKSLVDYDLDTHYGTIDTLHAMVGILRQKYVLRISKKTDDDKMQVIV